jgi:hypothetical protein
MFAREGADPAIAYLNEHEDASETKQAGGEDKPVRILQHGEDRGTGDEAVPLSRLTRSPVRRPAPA